MKTIPTYYDTPEKLMRLRAAAARVIGTPFFANSEAPGADGGMDCVHLLNWIHRTCGAIGAVEIPHQRMDHGLHHEHSLLIEAFDTWPGLSPRFARVWASPVGPDPRQLRIDFPELLAGDVLCFLQGKVPHHGGLYVGAGEMLHTLKGDGAHVMQLNAAVRGWRVLGYLAAVYRPLPL